MAQNKYIGAKKCGMCHKSKKIGAQYKIWKKSGHANAFKTLQTKEADEIAKAKGYKTKAAETPECLKCHVTAYGVDKSLLGKKFKPQMGVQCESCHGPGSAYAKNSIMKDRNKSIAKGLKLYDDDKEKIKAMCVTCHNPENPTHEKHGFDFDKYWNEIKHEIPGKK
jgi:cytochrome c peroxidase